MDIKDQLEELKGYFQSKGVSSEDFTFGKLVNRPGMRGLISVNNKWYIYDVSDPYCELYLTGPLKGKAVLKACAIFLCDDEDFVDYEFTDEELDILLDSQYRSIKEILQKDDLVIV